MSTYVRAYIVDVQGYYEIYYRSARIVQLILELYTVLQIILCIC